MSEASEEKALNAGDAQKITNETDADADYEEEFDPDARVDIILESLHNDAANESNFDIYQICGFRAKNGSRIYFFITVIKALLCNLLQISSIPLLLWEVGEDAQKGFCDKSGEPQLRYIGFLIVSFISSLSYEWMDKNNQKGFYVLLSEGEDYKPKWLNHYWLVYGNFVNVLLCFEIVFASAWIVYVSESILDMVLNSVALFFIVELDDMLVTSNAYRLIYKFIDEGKAKEQYGKELPKCCWSGKSMLFIEIIASIFYLGVIFGVIGLPIWLVICI